MNFAKQIIFSDFVRKILNLFSAVEHYIWHILGMFGSIDMKQKEMSQMDAMLTSVLLTLTFDLDFWP